MKRSTKIFRETNETDIQIALNIDGVGKRSVITPVRFLNHMLDLFAKHGLFDLQIKAKGDIDRYADEHHTVEDIAIALGQAFNKAIGDKKGINRYGFFVLPMDETLATVAVDFSGRYSFQMKSEFKREKVGDFSTELVYDFWNAFAQNAKINLFIKTENARNDHHQIEAIFKGVARAIRMACTIDKRERLQIPSTKGIL